jgi:hypothetical protein
MARAWHLIVIPIALTTLLGCASDPQGLGGLHCDEYDSSPELVRQRVLAPMRSRIVDPTPSDEASFLGVGKVLRCWSEAYPDAHLETDADLEACVVEIESQEGFAALLRQGGYKGGAVTFAPTVVRRAAQDHVLSLTTRYAAPLSLDLPSLYTEDSLMHAIVFTPNHRCYRPLEDF